MLRPETFEKWSSVVINLAPIRIEQAAMETSVSGSTVPFRSNRQARSDRWETDGLTVRLGMPS